MKNDDLSDRKLKIGVALATAIICWWCLRGGVISHAQTNPANLSPNLQEVVKLSAAHMSDDVILAYIKNSGSSYNLSADDILYLHGQGVSQAVIGALLNASPSQAPAPAPNAAPNPAPTMNVPPPVIARPTTPAPLIAAAPAPPLPGSEVTLSYFQTRLSPFGGWLDVPGYGLCWRPTAQDSDPGWRPYFNGGHWDYTDDGWYWKSDYPWGEYVFHYGRWARDPSFGWIWTPGYEWAPAWVCWRNAEAEGFCGWAPLPPGARFEAGVGLFWNGHLAVDADFALGPDAFVFIPFDRFWEHDYRAFLAPSWRWPDLFHRSVLANGYRFVGGRFIVDGIGRDRIGFLTHHEIVTRRIDFRDGRIAHARELEHAHAIEVQRNRGFAGHELHDGERRDDHHF
jgi:hypothetical protein